MADDDNSGSSKHHSNDDGPSSGAVAGEVIGGLFGFVFLAGVVYLAVKRPAWAMEPLERCLSKTLNCCENLCICCYRFMKDTPSTEDDRPYKPIYNDA
jgi:hypothetical protein